MAALICGLVASWCTSNAYSLRAWKAADDFSVTTGRTMVSIRSGIGLGLRPRARQGRELDHHGVRPEDLVGGGVGERHHVHPGDVAPGEIDVVRRGRAGGEHADL